MFCEKPVPGRAYVAYTGVGFCVARPTDSGNAKASGVGRAAYEELLEGFKKNYKRPKMWICIGIIAFCFVLLFPYIDSNFFYFSRMEKRIDILDRRPPGGFPLSTP